MRCSRVKRWWLLLAESTRWQAISLTLQSSGRGFTWVSDSGRSSNAANNRATAASNAGISSFMGSTYPSILPSRALACRHGW